MRLPRRFASRNDTLYVGRKSYAKVGVAHNRPRYAFRRDYEYYSLSHCRLSGGMAGQRADTRARIGDNRGYSHRDRGSFPRGNFIQPNRLPVP